jgi:hypothetical protein
VFIEFHVDSLATKLYALHGEAKALLGCGVPAEFDLAAGTDDALPWQRDVAAQELCDRSMVERIAGGCGDFTVGRDFSLFDGTNDSAEGVVAGLIFAEGVFQDSSLEILRRNGASHGETVSKMRRGFPSRRRLCGILLSVERVPLVALRMGVKDFEWELICRFRLVSELRLNCVDEMFQCVGVDPYLMTTSMGRHGR